MILEKDCTLLIYTPTNVVLLVLISFVVYTCIALSKTGDIIQNWEQKIVLA